MRRVFVTLVIYLRLNFQYKMHLVVFIAGVMCVINNVKHFA